jgi:hypothetical protein
MSATYKNFLRKDPLSHKDAQFINVIYFAPLGMLMQLDKKLIQHSLTKAKLVCQWLEGILDLAERHGKGE